MKEILGKIDYKKVVFVLFYIFAFTLLLRNSFNYLDPDLGWHLKVGEEIAATGAVPDINHYNYVSQASWVDHEWLSNWLVYQIYSHWGYLVLSIIFALLVVLVLFLLNKEATRRFPELPLGFILGLETFGLVACLPHFGLRIQELGLVFVTGLLLFISYYECRPRRRLLLILPLAFYLWASLHASFLLGLGLLAAWLGIKILERILARGRSLAWLDLSALWPWSRIVDWLGVFFLSALATCLTPYRLKLYSFLSDYSDSFYRSHLQEWLSQFSFPFTYWQLAYLALVTLSLFLYIHQAFFVRRRRPLELWNLFLVVFFLFLSWQSRRHFPLMFAVTFLFVLETHLLLWPISIMKERSKANIWLRSYLLACLLLVSLFQLTQTKFSNNPFRSSCEDYPCAATDFLRSHPEYDGHRLFNHYAWGGYLIWEWPERQLFIDGRLPQLPFAGHTYLAEYQEFFRAGIDFSAKLKQYDIALVLLPAQDHNLTAAAWERWLFMISDEELVARNRLRDFLQADASWQKIYEDAAAVVYARRD